MLKDQGLIAHPSPRSPCLPLHAKRTCCKYASREIYGPHLLIIREPVSLASEMHWMYTQYLIIHTELPFP
ncbi:hypothetical protein M408DRAFT_121864 [Serendipita vermifera MAFF 305830]|uniref:Uncharacterized protein n=1 Tax=Serendipita vermifera MAFF 305830 TaxID=933852 RepID=A0A0C3AXL7_SERVB|nr:hypothetical protein M408DRAFT_121864 [Serendipita vermifera MAFF 305830]